jgi:hypothetical protein
MQEKKIMLEILVPGVVDGISWITILLLSGVFAIASAFDCLSSIEFIGSGVISLSFWAASFISFFVAVRNVSYISWTYATTDRVNI